MSDINREWHEKVEGECPHEYCPENVGTSEQAIYCPICKHRQFLPTRETRESLQRECRRRNTIPAHDKDPAVFKKAVVGLLDEGCLILKGGGKIGTYIIRNETGPIAIDRNPQHAAMRAYMKIGGKEDGA